MLLAYCIMDIKHLVYCIIDQQRDQPKFINRRTFAVKHSQLPLTGMLMSWSLKNHDLASMLIVSRIMRMYDAHGQNWSPYFKTSERQIERDSTYCVQKTTTINWLHTQTYYSWRDRCSRDIRPAFWFLLIGRGRSVGETKKKWVVAEVWKEHGKTGKYGRKIAERPRKINFLWVDDTDSIPG
jgi:hypothetical protein